VLSPPTPGSVLLSSSSFLPCAASEFTHAPSDTSMTRDHCPNYLQCSRELIRRRAQGKAHDHCLATKPLCCRSLPCSSETGNHHLSTLFPMPFLRASTRTTTAPLLTQRAHRPPKLIVEVPKYPFRPAQHSTRSRPTFGLVDSLPCRRPLILKTRFSLRSYGTYRVQAFKKRN
jgi:hypothetical protein